MKKIVSFIILVLLAGCKTNPPEIPVVPPAVTGKVFIEGNVVGAAIYVDNNNTGKFSPDTIIAEIGDRVIRLEKENYLPQNINIVVREDSVATINFMLEPLTASKIVLLEDFANVACNPCVVSNQIIESLTRNTYGSAKLVSIKYPTNFPGPNDLFYLASQLNCDVRMNYYNIFSAPTTIIDGRMRPTSSDSIKIKDSINVRLALPPKFKMTINKNIAGDVYSTTVTIETLDTAEINFANLVLHTVVTEIEIEFASPPGSNGERKFYDVMREMLPTHAGENIQNINEGGIFTYNRSVILSGAKASWQKSKLHTVAFIQDKVSKEIYQAVSTH